MSHNRSNKDDKDEICKVQSEDFKKQIFKIETLSKIFVY